MDRRPNFLLIITDQHRADHLGCYGNDVVQTPNIDGLAARGTRFDRFYVATPICMPNRSTLMTGRMPSLHGVRHNGIPLSLSETTFTELLRATGYRTALVGKSHLQSISAKQVVHGFPEHDPSRKLPPDELREARKSDVPGALYDQELPPTWKQDPDFEPGLPFYGFDHVRLAIGHGDEVTGHYDRWLAARHSDPESLKGPKNALPFETECPQAWRTRIPEELYPTSFVAEETLAFLDAYAASERDQPFFLQCSFPDPHHPFTPPGRYWDMYDPADVPLPRAFNHPAAARPPHLAAIHEERREGGAHGSAQTVCAVSEAEARAAIAFTYGSISMIDDAVGKVLERLVSLGLSDDTVVIFTTDHGDFMGDHGLLLKGALHYQGLIRVPCIWADPSNPRASVSSSLCGTLDLAPSILIRAGIEPFNGMQGCSLFGAAECGGDRDCVLIEDNPRRSYMGMPSNFVVRTLVTDRWRLSVYSATDWGELYDLQSDPLEFENLWPDPAWRDTRAELMEMLARRMMALGERSPLARGHGP